MPPAYRQLSVEEPSPDEICVLLIEDDLDAQANLRDILDLDGFQILVAGTAAEGRRHAKQAMPEVTLLDRQLPDSNADQLLPELCQLNPLGDVIVVTGFADIESTIAALRHGASDYILKPINPGALRASLERIVRRRTMERQLLSEQQFAERVLRTAEAVILVLNLDGTIVDYNPFFERLTDRPLAEAVGQDWFETFIPPQEMNSVRDVFMAIKDDACIHGFVNEVMARDGSHRSIRWSNTTLKDRFGNTTAILSVGVDVTAYLLAQQRALQSERLATIGQTMTGLAHESRNALQRIQASLELLSLEVADNPQCQDDLAKIQRATRDLNGLLEEVRSYAAPIVLHITTTDLVKVWRRCWRDVEASQLGRDIELIEHVHVSEISGESTSNSTDSSTDSSTGHSSAGSSLVANLDELRMEQVFRNLFENAVSACSDPVRVTINGVDDHENGITITVTDNGPGLSAQQHKRIFEPFYTTKSTGTGLGMSIVQRIVLAHQGTIVVGPPSSSGASLTIHLPWPSDQTTTARDQLGNTDS